MRKNKVHIKKWVILFLILVFPYLLLQVVEKATHNIFEFRHLMGMYEKKYQYLADNGSLVNTYIPYGPYNKMFPYLSRRMYENIDMVKYMVN